MMLRFLLDTNVVSEPLRPQPSTRVMRRLLDHEGEMAIPSLVWHELRFGCARVARVIDLILVTCNKADFSVPPPSGLRPGPRLCSRFTRV